MEEKINAESTGAEPDVLEQILQHDIGKAQHLWDAYNKAYKPKGLNAKKYFIAGAVSCMSFIRHMETLAAKKGKEDE